MDDDRFDALSARLASHMTRRHGVGLLSAVGLAVVAGESDIEAKRRKKKKKKCKGGCGACATCVKGKCQPVADGAVCGQGGCSVCSAGACQAVANGTSCAQDGCKTCTGGVCQTVANGTTCGGGACQSGACRCVNRDQCPGGGTVCFCDEEFQTGLNRCWDNSADTCNINVGNCDANSDCGPGEGCLRQTCFVPSIGICWPLCAA